ncbi:MAG: aspartate kinase, partial [Planctomycetota bacterium]
MAIIVQKYGGTSVADADKIRRAANRVIEAVENGYKVVVVASARGKQTDRLINDALELNPNPPKREMDQLLSTGEQQSVSLFAMALDAMGHDAISFTGGQVRMITDSDYTKARIKSVDAKRIQKELDKGKIVIVAGFQGIDENENITTLGRGGSDTTAVVLAAALDAQECEIYTDVDGIHTTDPRIFKNAAKMDQISYDEMLELASLGAGVIYTRAVEVGKNYNVNIHVRSSLHEREGTIITHEVPQMEGVVVSGATVQRKMAKVGLVGVDNKPGNAAKIFAGLASAKVVINDIMQTEVSEEKANVSFTINNS